MEADIGVTTKLDRFRITNQSVSLKNISSDGSLRSTQIVASPKRSFA